MWDEEEKRLLVSLPKTCYKVGKVQLVAEAYTTQPNSKAGSRVLYVYLACMAG